LHFCGTKEHSSWEKCKVEGKASKLNATVVQESQSGYRLFMTYLKQPNHYIEKAVTTSIEPIYDKIPHRCRHIVVHNIVQVPVTSGFPSSHPSCIQFNRIIQLQIFAKFAIEIDEYSNKYFHLQGVIDWITESGNKKKITRRVFHRLKTKLM